jgi:PAS domain S-box-containing protein
VDIQRYETLLFINFFLLAFAVLAVYYYAYRLRIVLKRSERLRQLAEKYRFLFDSTTEGVFQTSLDGNIILMNNGGAKILGFENQEDLFQSGLMPGHFYQSEKEQAFVIETLSRNEVISNRVVKAKRKDGEELYLEYTVHGLYDDSNKLTGMEGMFRDVSKRIRLEEEIKSYSEDLEKKVHEKTDEILTLEREHVQLEKLASMGKMGASIVHEIRNPLSSIKMGLTTLIKRAGLNDKDQRCLELATGEVTHLERILRDLLDFSKPQSLNFSNQNVNGVLDMVTSQLDEGFRNAGVSIHKAFSQSLPAVRMDMDCLSQVFMNALLNAKQAMPEGGEIRIQTEVANDKKMVCVSFQDSGKGMEQETMDKVFEPFFSTKDEGTGLGLTISKQIVEAHGGIIRIQSGLEKGTSLFIDLPILRTEVKTE